MYIPLDSEGFHRRFGNLFNAIFCGREVRKASFRNSQWSFALTTRRFLADRRNFAALANAIKRGPDEEIVITEIEPYVENPGHTWTAIISADYDSYLAAVKADETSMLLVVNKAIFGSSGKWAAIEDSGLHCSIGYTIFGGEREIVASWADSLGGMKAIREEFEYNFNWPGYFPHFSPEVMSNLLKKLLKDVGWE